MIKKNVSIISILLIVSMVSSCASVVHTWDSYPIGTELEVNEKKTVYVASVDDQRKANIIVSTEEPVPGDIYKINEYYQILYVEDPEIQTATVFLAAAIKQDLRDAGFELTNIESEADYILETNLIKMEASKFRNKCNAILVGLLAIPTFGMSIYFLQDDIAADCIFKTSIIDGKTKQVISSNDYSYSETQKQMVLIEGQVINPGYYMIKCVKKSIQQLISDLIAVSE